jgi:hypothetical protein
MKYRKKEVICLRCLDVIRVLESDYNVTVVDDYCPECKEIMKEE